MIRFSSVTVPFADATIPLAAGAVLSPGQLAELVAVNALPEAVAVVSADRPTLLAATKAFAAALRSAKPVAPAPVAQSVVARFGKAALAPCSGVAPKAESSAALAERWGAVVDRQAAEIVALKADVAALQANCDALELELLAARAEARKAPAKRTRKAKVVAVEAVPLPEEAPGLAEGEGEGGFEA
jgi:hypothetical protein